MATVEMVESEITEEQRQILEEERDFLVLAGPGCGKTTTMILKIKDLLSKGVPPDRILLLTFSLRVSQELSERLKREGLSGIRVDTFHGLAYDLWRDLYGKSPDLISEEKRARILRKLFPGRKDPLRDPSARELYFQYLRKHNLCDFDLLLYLERDLSGIFEDYYLFIDEFQDITPEILHFLSHFKRARLYLFGDPNQSIYGFRGVNLDQIRSFLDLHRPDLRILSLTKSFRCPQRLLDFAKTLQCSPWQPQSFLSTRAGGTLQGFLFPDEQEERDFLVNFCYSLLGGLGLEKTSLRGISPSQILVIARVKKVLDPLKETFLRRGLPVASPEERGEELKRSLTELAGSLRTGNQPLEKVLSNLDPYVKTFVQNLLELFSGDKEKLAGLLLGLNLGDLIFPSTEGINFLTIHSAKGLEAEVVILLGAEDGLLPLTLFRDFDLDEEKRVLYVALTRAKESLYFTATKERKLYNRTINGGISRWLRELPVREFRKRPPAPKQGGLF